MDKKALMVLITPERVPLNQLGGFCAALARGGASDLQLRDKKSGIRDVVRYGKALRDVTRQWHLRLIVDDRVDVGLAILADGVHVGQTDLPVRDVRRIAPSLTVGLSVSNLQQVPQDDEDVPDYFGIGPIYPTASKSDASPPLGMEGAKALVAALPPHHPIYAIGGISLTNVRDVWGLGIQGIAVISAVLDAPDYEAASRRLLKEGL